MTTVNANLLPRTVSTVVASKIAGLSTRTFRARCLQTGLVKTDPDTGQVLLWSLAAYLGRVIDITEFLWAEKKRAPARAYQRQYAAARRKGVAA